MWHCFDWLVVPDFSRHNNNSIIFKVGQKGPVKLRPRCIRTIWGLEPNANQSSWFKESSKIAVLVLQILHAYFCQNWYWINRIEVLWWTTSPLTGEKKKWIFVKIPWKRTCSFTKVALLTYIYFMMALSPRPHLTTVTHKTGVETNITV